MWPFRNLKLELDQAERANVALRNKLRDTNADWRKAYEVAKKAFAAERDWYKNAHARLVVKYDAMTKIIRDTEAERDAAIRHAGRLSEQLNGAMVRDSNGRLRKWAEPEPVLMGVARTNTYFDNRCGEMDG